MKILFVINTLSSGGAERVLSELANYFADVYNYDTYILTISKYEDFYEISKNIKLIKLNIENNKYSIINSFERVSKLVKSINKIKPDIIISFMTSTNIESIIASKLLKIPIIISERANPTTSALGKWRYLRKMLYPFANSIVCQTRDVALFYKNYQNNIKIIPNSLKRFDEKILKRENVILSVGRLDYLKGFDLLIKSFSNINSKNWKLFIVGDGEYRKNLEIMVEYLNLSDKIYFLGKQKDIESYYKKASIFVLSSRTEGFPNVLCEAMANGVATISFDCDFGPRDIIKNGVDGVLVPAENTELLGKEIEKLINSPKLREKLGKKALKINSILSIDKIANEWKDLIFSILKKINYTP